MKISTADMFPNTWFITMKKKAPILKPDKNRSERDKEIMTAA